MGGFPAFVCMMCMCLGVQVDWNNIIYPTTVLLAQLTDDKAFHDGAQAYFQKWLCRHALTLRLACSQQRPCLSSSHVGAKSCKQHAMPWLASRWVAALPHGVRYVRHAEACFSFT